MPGFLPSEVKTYQYAANLVYDELIDKYGPEKVNKYININKIKQAVEKAKAKGMPPHQAAERLYNGIDKHIKGVKKMPADDLKKSLKNLGVKQSLKKGSVEQAIKDSSLDQSLKNLNKKGGASFASGAETAEKGAAKAVSKLGKFGKITGGLALATTLIYGSYQIYKRYLSAAAKACSNKTGNDRKNCIDQYRSNARKEQIKKLQYHLKDCTKSKDPMSCKKAILNKIQKINKRL